MAKMAENRPKQAQNIIFFHIFIKLYIFKNFWWFFLHFFDHFWPFLIFGDTMVPKWAQTAPNHTKINFLQFLWSYIFLRIFCDFFTFFWPFLTVDFWGAGTIFDPLPWAQKSKMGQTAPQIWAKNTPKIPQNGAFPGNVQSILQSIMAKS